MRVVWNERAELRLAQIMEYGISAFGEKAAQLLMKEIRKNEARLAVCPYLGKKELVLEGLPISYRSLVIHRNYKLIYYIEDETVYIATLFDNRRNPAVMTDHLK